MCKIFDVQSKTILKIVINLFFNGVFAILVMQTAWSKTTQPLSLELAEQLKQQTKQAQQGDAASQYQLGLMYLEGQVVEQNNELSFKWLEKAAKQGHAQAMFELGERYYYGQGVIADGELAFYWHLKAAHASDPLYLISPPWGYEPLECQQFDMNFDAASFDQREAQKVLWRQYEAVLQEVDAGNAVAQFCLGTMLLATYGEEKMVEQARIRARVWLSKAAAQGYSKAQNDLASIYRAGWGVKPRPEEALKWYLRSAKQGDAAGQFGAGMMYLGDFGVAQKLDQTLYWLQLAATQKHSGALYQLGKLYEQGRGVEKDERKALELYHAAAEEGVYHSRLLSSAEAAYRAGRLYYNGSASVGQNDDEAFSMFEEAWGINDRYRIEEAAAYLGVMHIQGRGVVADPAMGVDLLQEASVNGLPSAVCLLEQLGVKNTIQQDGEAIVPANINMKKALQHCPLPKEVPDYLCCF